MTRHIIGPFNRVEGYLELRLDIDDGVVTEARVTAPLYRGFEQILVGRPALDALAIAPRICGICSVSQSIAAASALRAIAGLEPAPNGILADAGTRRRSPPSRRIRAGRRRNSSPSAPAFSRSWG